MPLLSSDVERDNAANFQATEITDKSITTLILSPIWNLVVRLVPEDTAPNVLSLAGLLCTLHAWFLTHSHMQTHPRVVCFCAAVLILIFWTLDAIDRIHAKRIRNESCVTELFDHSCATIASIFVVLTLCNIFGINSLLTQWFLVQCVMFCILDKMIEGFKYNRICYKPLGGPGEALLVAVFCIVWKATLGTHWVWTLVTEHAVPILEWINTSMKGHSARPLQWDEPTFELAMQTLFAIFFVTTLFRTLMLGSAHSSTRNGLIICLAYGLIPGDFILNTPFGLLDVVAGGLTLSTVAADLVVARIVKRELHPWVVLLSMVAVVSNFSAIAVTVFYFCKIFFELCQCTHLGLLSVTRNVYVDGVYDLCHIGHMKAFKNALQFGTRLFVGVCSDEDVALYKRKPVMTTQERAEVVSACKYVYKVILNAPCTKGALTEAFLRKHNIHIVCLGEEYDSPTDQWYAAPRKLGMVRILPRTQTMSTSELISRIRTRTQEATI